MFDLVSKKRPLHYNAAKTIMIQLTERTFDLQGEKLFFFLRSMKTPQQNVSAQFHVSLCGVNNI